MDDFALSRNRCEGGPRQLRETQGAWKPALIKPVRIADLPVVKNVMVSGHAKNQAALSWRWDVDPKDGSSRNVAGALTYARDTGLDHLFIDVVSVDQALAGLDLARTVAEFTRLFARIPAITAYDTAISVADNRHFLRVLRRPWIAREVREMRYSPHRIRYVSHIAGQGGEDHFGFSHMVDRIWNSSFANSFLYVLTGKCDMYDISELQFIMPEYYAVLAAASQEMPRNDALLTAAILSQLSADDRVNGDIDIREKLFENDNFAQSAASPGYWENWQILLDGTPLGLWSEKDYTRDGDPKRKLSSVPDAYRLLAIHFNVETLGDAAVGQKLPSSGPLNNLENIEIIDYCRRFTH